MQSGKKKMCRGRRRNQQEENERNTYPELDHPLSGQEPGLPLFLTDGYTLDSNDINHFLRECRGYASSHRGYFLIDFVSRRHLPSSPADSYPALPTVAGGGANDLNDQQPGRLGQRRSKQTFPEKRANR